MCVLNESRCCTRTGVQRVGKVQSKIFKFVVVNWKEVTVFFSIIFQITTTFPGNGEFSQNAVFVMLYYIPAVFLFVA